MEPDEVDLWIEAIDAREELEFQEELSMQNLEKAFEKNIMEARRRAKRDSEYKWHDKLRIEIDLRKLRR